MSEDQDPKQPGATGDQPNRPESGPPAGPQGGSSAGSGPRPEGAGPGPRSEGAPQYGDRRGPGGPPRGPGGGGPPRGPGGPPRGPGGPGGPPRGGGYGGPPRGGPGGGRRDSPYPQRRFPRRFRRGKVCAFCVNKVHYIDYKALDTIRKFITDRGKILPRRITGNCARHQRMLCSSIERARHTALIPFKVK